MSAEQLADVSLTFDLRAAYGSCLAQLKDLDKTALALFPLLYQPSLEALGEPSPDSEDAYSPGHSELTEAEMLARTDRMHKLADFWKLRGCHSWTPLIDGKQVLLLQRHS